MLRRAETQSTQEHECKLNFMGCLERNISVSCSQSGEGWQLDMLVFAVDVRADQNIF